MSGINNESSLFNSEERKGELEKEFSSYIKKSDLEQSGLQSFPENGKKNTIKIDPIPLNESEESTNDDDINQKYQQVLSENIDLKEIINLLLEDNEKLKKENEQYKKQLDIKNELKKAAEEKKERDDKRNKLNKLIQEFRKKKSSEIKPRKNLTENKKNS